MSEARYFEPRTARAALGAALALAATATGTALAPRHVVRAGEFNVRPDGRVAVMVELSRPPVAEVYARR
jgi:hypothetical protein